MALDMALSSEDVFTNGTFVFQTSDGAKLTAYKVLVARTSRTLTAKMENGMQESRSGVAVFPNTNKATFVRFLEFAHTGDYNPAKAQAKESDSQAGNVQLIEGPLLRDPGTNALRGTTSESVCLEDQVLYELAPTPKRKAEKRKAEKKRRYCRMDDSDGMYAAEKDWDAAVWKQTGKTGPEMPLLLHSIVYVRRPMPTDSEFAFNIDQSLDHLPVFMSHAEMYVFVDKYNITELQDLAAARLNDALNRFNCRSDSLTNIAELVTFTYENTTPRDVEMDTLRAVVTTFCAHSIGVLVETPSFHELLGNGRSGEFVQELLPKCYDAWT